MQKVLRRTLLAERQAARRLARRKETARREFLKSESEQAMYAQRDRIRLLKEAKQARWEDHTMGPLAPKRDVGSSKDSYGTVSQFQLRGRKMLKAAMEERLKSIGGKYLCIVKGDRVVLLKGKDKGKIGKIIDIDEERGTCTIEGVNIVDMEYPSYMISPEDPDKRPFRSFPAPVDLLDVRLVTPMENEQGETVDVIVKKIVRGGILRNRAAGETTWRRYFPEGLPRVSSKGVEYFPKLTEIPWPEKEEPEYQDQPIDTLRIDVEQKTFIPTLLRPPMPGTVIDELRNKYSKFRTRHDPEFIAAKMEEDRQAEERKRLIKTMRTPLQELNKRIRNAKRRKKAGVGRFPALTPQVLAQIGETVAKNKPELLTAAIEAEIKAKAAAKEKTQEAAAERHNERSQRRWAKKVAERETQATEPEPVAV